MQGGYLELKVMVMPASSFCVSVLITEDNEPLTVHRLMNKALSVAQEGGP